MEALVLSFPYNDEHNIPLTCSILSIWTEMRSGRNLDSHQHYLSENCSSEYCSSTWWNSTIQTTGSQSLHNLKKKKKQYKNKNYNNEKYLINFQWLFDIYSLTKVN